MPHLRWIVAADGRRARVYEQAVQGAKLAPVSALEMSEEEARRAEPRDRPTRVQESVGPRRHGAQSEPSPHEQAEAAFLQRLAEHLHEAAQAKRYANLVLFAPPRALGVLRAALENKLAAPIEKSFDLDVVNETAEQLTARLREAWLR